MLEKILGHMGQELAGDCNELRNEELRSEFVFTKYPMKFRVIGWAII
jgi:hypothetical protein